MIVRLKIVQDMTAFERPRPARPRPIQVDVPEIEDDELRDALQRLGDISGPGGSAVGDWYVSRETTCFMP